MTAPAKFLLHGGRVLDECVENRTYFRRIVDSLFCPRVLVVLFAKHPDRVEAAEQALLARFSQATDSVLDLQFASEDSLYSQMEWADVLYFHGGQSLRLVDRMRPHLDHLRTCCGGRVIAGESAGVNMLHQWFVSHSEGGLREGLGILPGAVICHHDGLGDASMPSGAPQLRLPELYFTEFSKVVPVPA